MHKKKVLVHGTADSLQKFSEDAVISDFEVVAVLSEDDISVELDGKDLNILTPQALPSFVYDLIDGIILTDLAADDGIIKFFLNQGVAPRKIIPWNDDAGWGTFSLPTKDGTNTIYFCGLEFHIRDEEGVKLFNQTHWRLQKQRQVKNLLPQDYPAIVAQDYQRRTGKQLDFNNPRTFTEKLQWLKIYDATPIKSRLADKYLVRNWVADKIGAEYLIPLLGVWDDFDDIDFDDLPDQFVLKCNHGSGMNIIVRDKAAFDRQAAREKINAWLAFDYAAQPMLELHYTRINRKIIAEKFMANGNEPDLTDYKFWCFGGKPTVVQCETDRSTDLRFDYFDMNFNHTDIERSDHRLSDHPEKIRRPKNFELMKTLAAKLAEGFAFVRVDFYEIDGRVMGAFILGK